MREVLDESRATLSPLDVERRLDAQDPGAETRAPVHDVEPRQATTASGDPIWWVDSDAIWALDAGPLPSGDWLIEGYLFVRWNA